MLKITSKNQAYIETLEENNIHIKKELELIVDKHVAKKYLDFMYKKQQADIDLAEKKFSIVLKLVNIILTNAGKNSIDNLLKFQNIDRLDIIKKENIQALDNMAPELFKFYSKTTYYRKTPNIVLNVLRSVCKELGLSFINKPHSKRYGNTIKVHYCYSIIA